MSIDIDMGMDINTDADADTVMDTDTGMDADTIMDTNTYVDGADTGDMEMNTELSDIRSQLVVFDQIALI